MQPTPSAHACTPATQRTRRPASTATKPQARKPALLQFPPLPETGEAGTASGAAFWRAAFLRNLRMAEVAQQLLDKAIDQAAKSRSGEESATTLYLSNSLLQQKYVLKDSFGFWMQEIGGLASESMQQGGAA